MVTSDPNCSFCSIAAGRDDQVREVFRSDHVVAFMPTEPATLGHLLLIPVEHSATVWDLPELTAERLGNATWFLSKSVAAAVSPEGLNIIQSNGRVAEQTVDHVHVHLLPRWSDDAVGPIWPPEQRHTDADLDAVWHALKHAVDRLKK